MVITTVNSEDRFDSEQSTVGPSCNHIRHILRYLRVIRDEINIVGSIGLNGISLQRKVHLKSSDFTVDTIQSRGSVIAYNM